MYNISYKFNVTYPNKGLINFIDAKIDELKNGGFSWLLTMGRNGTQLYGQIIRRDLLSVYHPKGDQLEIIERINKICSEIDIIC